MAFSRVKAAGWAFGEVLTSSQMNSLDTDHANAIDGANGGTYNLAAPLDINGDDVSIGENLAVFGNEHVVGNLTTDGTFQANTLAVIATSSFAGPATFVDAASFQGNVTLGNASSDTVTVTGTPTFATPMKVSGSGRTCQTGKIVATGPSSVDVNSFQNIIISGGIATTTTTLTASAPVDGDWFVVFNDTGNAQTLAGLVSFSLPDRQSHKYVRISGVWVLVQRLLSA